MGSSKQSHFDVQNNWRSNAAHARYWVLERRVLPPSQACWVDNLPEVSPRYSTQDHKTSFTLSPYLDLTRVLLLEQQKIAMMKSTSSDNDELTPAYASLILMKQQGF
ncbi:hypothetical protein D5086_007734 [Populus alba]|uniref:Uncharacterized protein n=1 Tax=Populus alba TaxID=43335 RepID=A0ACC4CF54_POPAL